MMDILLNQEELSEPAGHHAPSTSKLRQDNVSEFQTAMVGSLGTKGITKLPSLKLTVRP